MAITGCITRNRRPEVLPKAFSSPTFSNRPHRVGYVANLINEFTAALWRCRLGSSDSS